MFPIYATVIVKRRFERALGRYRCTDEATIVKDVITPEGETVIQKAADAYKSGAPGPL